MKILHVIESSGGGSGKHVIDLARCQKQSGHNVSLIYSPLRMDDKFRLGLKSLERLGVFLYQLNIDKELSISDLFVILRIVEICKREKYDVVHGHSTKAGAIVRLLKVFLIDSIVIYTPHGSILGGGKILGFKKIIYSAIEKFLLNFADRIIAVSDQERKVICAAGVPEAKIYMIPNGVDLDYSRKLRDQIDVRRLSEKENIVLGFVGRLEPPKNPQRAIKIFYECLKEIKNLKLVIVGDGNYRAELDKMCLDYRITDKVEFLGAVEGLSAMKIFDGLIVSSDNEGFPYVVLEGLSMGLPIFSTAVGGINLTIENGKNGFFSNDESELIKSVIKVFADDNLIDDMRKFSFNLADRFSVEKMEKLTFECYLSVE